MGNKVCDSERVAKIDIPGTDFLSAITPSTGDLLRKTVNLSEPGSYLLIGVYSLLKNGAEWTPVRLFQAIAKDPELSRVIKNRPTLIHHLEALVKLGILRKVESEKVKYALNEPNLKAIQMLDQLMYNKGFKAILEEHYTFIYIITCSMARLIRPLFPDQAGASIFDLASTLIQAGVKLAVKDLEPRQVLKQQCAECIYPFHAQNEWENDLPFDSQVKQFIGIKKDGVLKSEILDYFGLLGHPEGETTQILQELINRGETRINAGRYILNT